MLTMLWKEWRENRALIAAILLAVVGLLPALRALEILKGFQEDWIASQIVVLVLSSCIGASLVAGETSRGTLELLWTRPVARWRLWAGKVVFGLAVCLGLCLALALTIHETEVGSQNLPAMAYLLWPYEAVLGLAAGLYAAGLIRSPLTGGLVGVVLASLLGLIVFVSPLRLTIFSPLSVVSLFLASWFTFREANESRVRRRVGAAALGALAGLALFPATYLGCSLLSQALGPGKTVRFERCGQVPGKRQMVAQFDVEQRFFEPLRPGASEPWKNVPVSRLALIDLDSGRWQWLPPQEVRAWRISAASAQVVGLSKPAFPRGEERFWCIDLAEPDEVHWIQRWGFPPLVGSLSRFSSDSGDSFTSYWWSLRGVTPRPGPLAAPTLPPLPAGSFAEAFSAEILDMVRPWPDRPTVVAEVGNSEAWKSAGTFRHLWKLDLTSGLTEPIVPLDDQGVPLPGAALHRTWSIPRRDWVVFETQGRGVGVCRLDGSGARTLELEGFDPRSLNRQDVFHSNWAPDCRTAVIHRSVFRLAANQTGEAWLLNVAGGKGRPVPLPGESLETLVPMPEGVFVFTHDKRFRCNKLYWTAPGLKEPVLVRETAGRMKADECAYHRVVHPFALEWVPATPASTQPLHAWWDRSDRSGLSGCRVELTSNLTPGGKWNLLVLRPPGAGGVTTLELEHSYSHAVPTLMTRGRRALVLADFRVAAVDAGEAQPRLRPVLHEGPADGTVRADWAQWVDDDVAVTGKDWGGIFRIDMRTLDARRLAGPW